MQQAHHHGCAIWAQPNHTLLGGSYCSIYVRARADQCFVAQTPVCARCTSLRSLRGQCLAEPPAIATPDSGSPGVFVPQATTYGGLKGMSTHVRATVQRCDHTTVRWYNVRCTISTTYDIRRMISTTHDVRRMTGTTYNIQQYNMVTHTE